MTLDELRRHVARILQMADVQLDGPQPWDLQVNDDRFYARVLTTGSLGLGESYICLLYTSRCG